MNELILGPQLPIGTTYFDLTQVRMARMLGERCPAVAPQPPVSPVKPLRKDFTSDESFRTALNTWLAHPDIKAWFDALNSFEVNLQYYDLPLSEYIVAKRTGDPQFLTLGDECADSFWTHPEWIGEGRIRRFPDEATPPPRHAGIMGLMCRAMRGRPEMWDWIVAYVIANLKIWLLSRIGNGVLHVDVREGAFALHYAVLLSQCLPDTFPLQSGETATNGAAIRAQLSADCERIILEYYKPLQYPCGCWRYDSGVTDGDGGTLVKVTQPFTLGLLLLAFVDLHKVTTNAEVKQTLEMMILKTSRHLYLDGPYRKNDPIPYDPRKRWRSLWYLWHGGTTLNPTKFEAGGWSYPGDNQGEVQDARQAIGPLIAIYGYAYKISGDSLYEEALTEMWDSAYGETDGIKTYFDTDGKGFNQHCRRAGSGPVWAGWQQTFPPSLPAPPDPLPPVDPVPPPSGSTSVNITAPLSGETISGKATVKVSVANGAGLTEMYLRVDGNTAGGGTVFQEFTLDTTKFTEGQHSLSIRAWKGSTPIDSKTVTVTVKNAVEPPPATEVNIQGKILKKDGSPVKGVRVLINPGAKTQVFTKEDGSFSFPALKPGKYVVIAGASNAFWVYQPGYRAFDAKQNITNADFVAVDSNDPELFK